MILDTNALSKMGGRHSSGQRLVSHCQAIGRPHRRAGGIQFRHSPVTSPDATPGSRRSHASTVCRCQQRFPLPRGEAYRASSASRSEIQPRSPAEGSLTEKLTVTRASAPAASSGRGGAVRRARPARSSVRSRPVRRSRAPLRRSALPEAHRSRAARSSRRSRRRCGRPRQHKVQRDRLPIGRAGQRGRRTDIGRNDSRPTTEQPVLNRSGAIREPVRSASYAADSWRCTTST